MMARRSSLDKREKIVGTNLSGAGGGICLFLDTLKHNMNSA
jgi:hypothetical protein